MKFFFFICIFYFALCKKQNWIYETDYSTAGTATFAQFDSIKSSQVAFDSSFNIIIGDIQGIKKFSSTRDLLWTNNCPYLPYYWDHIVDLDDNVILITAYYLVKLDKNTGNFIYSFGTNGAVRFQPGNPSGRTLVMVLNNRKLVVHCQVGFVKTYDYSGSQINSFAVDPAVDSNGIWVPSFGMMFFKCDDYFGNDVVCGFQFNHLLVYDLNGNLLQNTTMGYTWNHIDPYHSIPGNAGFTQNTAILCDGHEGVMYNTFTDQSISYVIKSFFNGTTIWTKTLVSNFALSLSNANANGAAKNCALDSSHGILHVIAATDSICSSVTSGSYQGGKDIIWYQINSTTGNFLQVTEIGTIGDEEPNNIQLDSGGWVYISGTTSGSFTNASFKSPTSYYTFVTLYSDNRILKVDPLQLDTAGNNITISIDVESDSYLLLTPSIMIGNYNCTNVRWIPASYNLTCFLSYGVGIDHMLTLQFPGYSLMEYNDNLLGFNSPVITNLSVTHGSTAGGNLVTVTGHGFANNTLDKMIFQIGGSNATIVSQTSLNSVVLMMPGGHGINRLVNMTAGGQSSNSSMYYNYDAPFITSVVPPGPFSTRGGESAILIGYNFGVCTNYGCPIVNSLKLGPYNCAVNSSIINDTAILCITPDNVGTGKTFSLTIDGQAAIGSVSVNYRKPTVSTVNPSTAGDLLGNQLLTISGSGFGLSNYGQTISISLKSFNSSLYPDQPCNSVTYTTDSIVLCTTPANVFQNNQVYYIAITVQGQYTLSNVSFSTPSPLRAIADPQYVSCLEDQSVFITLTGSDSKGGDLTFAVSRNPYYGSLKQYIPNSFNPIGLSVNSYLDNANVFYIPNTHFYGIDNFTFTVKDSYPSTVSINVTHVNVAPLISDQRFVTNENVDLDFTVIGSDVDDSTGNLEIVSVPQRGVLIYQGNTLSKGSVIQMSALNWQSTQQLSVPLQYKVPVNSYGSNFDSFTVMMIDPHNATSGNAVLSISVTHVYQPPVVYDSVVSIVENSPVFFTVNVTDIDLDAVITCQISSSPKYGTLYQVDGATGLHSSQIYPPASITNSNFRLYYSPGQYYFGTDTFNVTCNNDILLTQFVTGTVTINVIPRNNPPLLYTTSQDLTISGTWDGSSTIANQPLNISTVIEFEDVDESFSLTIVFDTISIDGLDLKVGSTDVADNFTTVNVPYSATWNSRSLMSLSISFIPNFKGGWYPFRQIKFHIVDSNGASSPKGSIQIYVNCPTKYYNNIWNDKDSNGVLCYSCPVGGVCSPTGQFYPYNDNGYWPTDDFRFLQCSNSQACPIGSSNLSATLNAEVFTNHSLLIGQTAEGASLSDTQVSTIFNCGAGYAGIRCSVCDAGYHTVGSSCVACSNSYNVVLIVVFVIVVIVVGSAFFWIVQSGFKFDVIIIFVDFLQCLSIFTKFKLKWPEKVTQSFHWTSSMNLNIDFLQPECFTASLDSFSFRTKWIVTALLPLGMLFLLLVVSAIINLLIHVTNIFIRDPRKKIKSPFSFNMAIKTFFTILGTFFLSLANNAMQYFNCIKEDNDRYYLFADLSKECFNIWWNQYRLTAIIFMVFYIFLVPCAFILIAYSQYLKFNGIESYRILSKRKQEIICQWQEPATSYTIRARPYWNTVKLISALIISSLNMFVSSSPAIQTIGITMVFIIYLILLVEVKPYEDRNIVLFESVCKACGILILLGGILFYVEDFKDNNSIYVLMFIVYGVIGGATLIVLYSFKKAMNKTLEDWKVTKEEQRKRRNSRKSISKQTHWSRMI